MRYIFGIVGATFLDVLDALYDDHSVEYVNVRHEQAGAFMADGLARVTGRPGVCLVTADLRAALAAAQGRATRTGYALAVEVEAGKTTLHDPDGFRIELVADR